MSFLAKFKSLRRWSRFVKIRRSMAIKSSISNQCHIRDPSQTLQSMNFASPYIYEIFYPSIHGASVPGLLVILKYTPFVAL